MYPVKFNKYSLPMIVPKIEVIIDIMPIINNMILVFFIILGF